MRCGLFFKYAGGYVFAVFRFRISMTYLNTSGFAPVIKTHLYRDTRGPMVNSDCHFHYMHKLVSLDSFLPSYL